jgi:uncharacterized protein
MEVMLAFLLALVTATSIPPKPAGYLTDNAHVLDVTRAHALNEKLAQFERETSNQLLVYVDRKLPPGTTVEQFANEAMHQWGVGQKGKDNGAVLFLFIDDRKMRIAAGYGLEARLTDARSRQITNTIIKPYLLKRDYTGAAESGGSAMIETVSAEHSRGTGKTVHETNEANASGPWGIVFGFIVLALIAGGVTAVIILVIRSSARQPRTPRAAGSSNMGLFDSTNTGTTDPSSLSSLSSSSWSSDSSSSSSSSSSFDGGGGDSGGGGASDSW